MSNRMDPAPDTVAGMRGWDSHTVLALPLDRWGWRGKVEAASGFEPLNEDFADPSLNHLGTPP